MKNMACKQQIFFFDKSLLAQIVVAEMVRNQDKKTQKIRNLDNVI